MCAVKNKFYHIIIYFVSKLVFLQFSDKAVLSRVNLKNANEEMYICKLDAVYDVKLC